MLGWLENGEVARVPGNGDSSKPEQPIGPLREYHITHWWLFEPELGLVAVETEGAGEESRAVPFVSAATERRSAAPLKPLARQMASRATPRGE